MKELIFIIFLIPSMLNGQDFYSLDFYENTGIDSVLFLEINEQGDTIYSNYYNCFFYDRQIKSLIEAPLKENGERYSRKFNVYYKFDSYGNAVEADSKGHCITANSYVFDSLGKIIKMGNQWLTYNSENLVVAKTKDTINGGWGQIYFNTTLEYYPNNKLYKETKNEIQDNIIISTHIYTYSYSENIEFTTGIIEEVFYRNTSERAIRMISTEINGKTLKMIFSPLMIEK